MSHNPHPVLSAFSFAALVRSGTVYLPADGLRAWLLESVIENQEERPDVAAALRDVADRISEMEKKAFG